MAARENSESWHLDKKVPIALIVTMMAQVVGFAWWASAQNSLVATHERRLDAAERRIDLSEGGARAISERVVRIEANTENIARSVQRIETAIGREARP